MEETKKPNLIDSLVRFGKALGTGSKTFVNNTAIPAWRKGMTKASHGLDKRSEKLEDKSQKMDENSGKGSE